jgi:hypothetical protein
MRATRCVKNPDGVSSFNYLRSTWGCSTNKCAFEAGAVTWKCGNTTIPCKPGTTVPLAGTCTTTIVGGTVMYYVPPSTTPVTSITCTNDAAVKVVPVLFQQPAVPKNCSVTGPPLNVVGPNLPSGARGAALARRGRWGGWGRAVCARFRLGSGHSSSRAAPH